MIVDTGKNYNFVTYLKENGLLSAPDGGVPSMLWVDCETTGLNRQGHDHVLELAAVATDRYGRVIPEGVFHTYLYNEAWYAAEVSRGKNLVSEEQVYEHMWFTMSEGAAQIHRDSGMELDHRTQWGDGSSEDAFNMRVEIASSRFLEWAFGIGIEDFKMPLSGSTVEFDRALMGFDVPEIEQFFHYRTINISSFKEVCRLTNPQLYAQWKNIAPDVHKAHRGMVDIAWSIQEYRFYLENFLITESDVWNS
jgi:oligoribonuclease (3'-5' exoribonuclease)